MEASNPSNPFESADPWEVSLDKPLFPVGNFLATITSVEDATAMSGNPQVIVRVENDSYSIRDWVAYHENFLSKIVAVFEAAGVARPQAGEFDPADHCRLSASCIARLVDRQVAVVVYDEDDDRPDHMGEKRRRVRGYRPASELTEDAPIDTAGLPAAGVGADPRSEFGF